MWVTGGCNARGPSPALATRERELLRPTAAHAVAFPSADAPHPKIDARYDPRPPTPVSRTRRRWA
jgi:hypothetical protein